MKPELLAAAVAGAATLAIGLAFVAATHGLGVALHPRYDAA